MQLEADILGRYLLRGERPSATIRPLKKRGQEKMLRGWKGGSD